MKSEKLYLSETKQRLHCLLLQQGKVANRNISRLTLKTQKHTTVLVPAQISVRGHGQDTVLFDAILCHGWGKGEGRRGMVSSREQVRGGVSLAAVMSRHITLW